MSYERDFAEVYDAIYHVHKDYAAEAAGIRDVALARSPHASSLLDLACGTGTHLAHLRETFDVVGVDLSESMVRIAREKLTGVPVHHADMRTVDVGRRFDVVSSMYASIGYLGGLDDLRAAAATMARHLTDKGVLVVEPWVLAERWDGGRLAHATFVNADRGLTVSRMGVWHTVDGRSVCDMQYLVSDGERVRHFTDHQSLALWTEAEYLGAFAEAGITAELVEGDDGRTLFVGGLAL